MLSKACFSRKFSKTTNRQPEKLVLSQTKNRKFRSICGRRIACNVNVQLHSTNHLDTNIPLNMTCTNQASCRWSTLSNEGGNAIPIDKEARTVRMRGLAYMKTPGYSSAFSSSLLLALHVSSSSWQWFRHGNLRK